VWRYIDRIMKIVWKNFLLFDLYGSQREREMIEITQIEPLFSVDWICVRCMKGEAFW
jgi:hypothetical protein